MSLAAQLQATYDGFHSSVPKDVSEPILKSTAEFKASFDINKAAKVGDKFPSFSLPDIHATEKTNADFKGATLFSFYRGEWCPYCNLELKALQNHLPDLKARGVSLVAISPELPDQSLSTTEKNDLEFTVLSDVGNKLARGMGIIFAQPDYLVEVAGKVGVDFKARNSDDSYVLPVPATFLVDEKGIIRNSFIDPDYTKRLEPETALAWIDAMKVEKLP